MPTIPHTPSASTSPATKYIPNPSNFYLIISSSRYTSHDSPSPAQSGRGNKWPTRRPTRSTLLLLLLRLCQPPCEYAFHLDHFLLDPSSPVPRRLQCRLFCGRCPEWVAVSAAEGIFSVLESRLFPVLGNVSLTRFLWLLVVANMISLVCSPIKFHIIGTLADTSPVRQGMTPNVLDSHPYTHIYTNIRT